jgi:short subunit fatty acids transporter
MATEQPGAVARLASSLTAWTERWVPDAFIFALLATVVNMIAGCWSAENHSTQLIAQPFDFLRIGSFAEPFD